jgi:hypothetical protein
MARSEKSAENASWDPLTQAIRLTHQENEQDAIVSISVAAARWRGTLPD